MDIKPFEELKITTMTLVMALSGSINTDVAFQLLPITRIVVNQVRETSKCKLPHCKTPGAILSMRYRGQIRGLIKSTSNPFKNAVTIDISTTKKNISLKLSAVSIQMCGASSREDGIEAATHILNHLRHIHHLLNKIKAEPEKTIEAIQWIKDITRGKLIERPQWVEMIASNVTLRIYQPLVDHEIINLTTVIPDHLDSEITSFLLSLGEDFLYHTDFCQKLDFVPKMPDIIQEPLDLKQVDEAMVNYNYSLGFEIDRALLNQFIDGQNGFISRYNNAFSTSVTIELPYEASKDSVIKRRKNKIPHSTLLVYKSSSVTLSTNNTVMAKHVYELFMNTVLPLRKYIEYKPPQTPQQNNQPILNEKSLQIVTAN